MTGAHTPAADWRLVADIGGTSARFAIAHDTGELAHIKTLPCDDFAGPAEAATSYLDSVGIADASAAAFAVAMPVVADWVTFTNRPAWSFSIAELSQRLGIPRLKVINDFTAFALSLPRLAADDFRKIGGGVSVASAPRAVVGPGTGLGVSALIPTAHGWHALDTEGGHVCFCASDAHELELQRVLMQRFTPLSAERVLSGPGLVNLYQAHCALAGQPAEALSPADISDRGLSGSHPLCRAVVDDFCALLGTIASNLVLTLGARAGVYIGGGIIPRLLPLLEDSAFRGRFENRGRLSSYLAAVPSYVVTADTPALHGALMALKQDQ